jgi:hypothetical protein
MTVQNKFENLNFLSDKELHAVAVTASQNHKLAEATLVSVLG